MEAFGAEALGIQSLAVWAVLYICGTPFHQLDKNLPKIIM
jgi:hypothetical protein